MNSVYGFLCAYVRLAGVYGLAHTLPHALFPRHNNNDGEFLVDRAMLGLSCAVIGLVYWPSMLHDVGIALESGWTSQSSRREVHGFGRRPARGEEGSRGVSPRERTGITATKATKGAKSASVRVKARDAGGRTGQVRWDT